MTNEEGHQQTIRRNRDAGDGDNTLHNMRGRRMKRETMADGQFMDACQDVANEVVELLREKNLSYGNSLQHPIGIFAPGDDRTRTIRVRIDDKLARFARGNMSFESEEDTVKDLLGYLIPLLVIMREDACGA